VSSCVPFCRDSRIAASSTSPFVTLLSAIPAEKVRGISHIRSNSYRPPPDGPRSRPVRRLCSQLGETSSPSCVTWLSNMHSLRSGRGWVLVGVPDERVSCRSGEDERDDLLAGAGWLKVLDVTGGHPGQDRRDEEL
jgi:hypothetical protein